MKKTHIAIILIGLLIFSYHAWGTVHADMSLLQIIFRFMLLAALGVNMGEIHKQLYGQK